MVFYMYQISPVDSFAAPYTAKDLQEPRQFLYRIRRQSPYRPLEHDEVLDRISKDAFSNCQ